jgi:DNA-binding XRE family transcriptional regulator
MKTIRVLRRERGWTQFDLALAVGVQPQTVYLWESGRRQPQVPQMRKLGQVFGLCSDEIELIPAGEPYRTSPHHARADRRAGETAPGRNPHGRAVFRVAEEAKATHEVS